MSYAGKTLLVAVLTKLASLCSANVALKGWGMPTSLMGLKAGKSSSVSRVISEVAELLQMHRDDPAAEHEVDIMGTDAVEVLKGALGDVISEIEEDVQPQIMASRDATQAEINKRIEDLINANTNLQNHKETADAADQEWMSCVSHEKAKAKNIEDATVALEEARNSRNATCQLQEGSKRIEYQMDPEPQFECDISLSPEHTCGIQWQEFVNDVEVALEAWETEVDAAVEVYTGHVRACEQAEADERAKEAHLTRAIQHYEEQHQRCLDHHEERQLAMCNFETRYRHKCGLVKAYQDLMTEIDTEDGGDYSHPDRVQEWKATTMAMCLFKQIIYTSVVAATHVDACEADVDTDQLNLWRQHRRFIEFTTAPNYDCEETTITFLGETWDIPASAPVPPAPSAEYQRVPFHPELPFSFCAASHGHHGRQ